MNAGDLADVRLVVEMPALFARGKHLYNQGAMLQRRRALGSVICGVSIALGCSSAAPTPTSTPPTPVVITQRSEVTAPEPPPPMPTAEALEAVLALEEAWSDVEYHEDEHPAFFEAHGIDDVRARAWLEAIARSCLARRDREAEECQRLGSDQAEAATAFELALDFAAEQAELDPQEPTTLTLLIRLDARGLYHASIAIERILERRMLNNLGPCEAPSVAFGTTMAKTPAFEVHHPKDGLRPATRAEQEDIAYFLRSMRATEEGTAIAFDKLSQALPESDPAHVTRKNLGARLEDALLDGELEEHALVAQAYLETLGYPGPIRMHEDGDRRWGGRGHSYVMRDWALTAEILGHYAVARSLYAAADPGGGYCGTSTASLREEQLEGVIRTSEQLEGCHVVIGERLYAAGRQPHGSYGPPRLEAAGLDVARLYRGALWTRGSTQDYSDRTRAIAGYGDTAGAASLDTLLQWAEHGDEPGRLEALRVLGFLLRSSGIDPCLPTRYGSYSMGSRGTRRVYSIQKECDTRVTGPKLDAVIDRVAKLAKDPEPEIRQNAAEVLGRIASPRARPVLLVLAQDTYDTGGEICTTVDDGPTECRPHMPVREAANEALEDLREAKEMHDKQLAAIAEAEEEP